MSSYRTAVIGMGFMGKQHADAYEKHPDTNLTDTYDIGYELSQGIDIVSVCTPPETHCQIVCNIAPYVKGIYCEKPIATTLKDADKMIDVCLENNVILQINHQRRFYKPVFTFSRGVLNAGTHAFDLLDYLFKPEIEVEIDYRYTDEFIFQLDCVQNDAPRVPQKAITHLIECIEQGTQSKSSGEIARRALELCLKFEKTLPIF